MLILHWYFFLSRIGEFNFDPTETHKTVDIKKWGKLTKFLSNKRKFFLSEYVTKLTLSIGSSCFETFKKKLSFYVVFIMLDIAQSWRQFWEMFL